MDSELRRYRTGDRERVLDLTGDVSAWARERGDGLVHLFVPHATVPIQAGRMLLGTWQSICLVDLNVDNHERQVRFSFLSGCEPSLQGRADRSC